MSYKEKKYCVLRNVMHVELCEFLYAYLKNRKAATEILIKKNIISPYDFSFGSFGDYQIPETIDESLVNDNELFQWWANHSFENGYSQEEFESGIAKYAQFADSFQPNLEEEKQQLGDNADARIEAVDLWANKFFPEELGDAILLLGQSAKGIQALEFIMDKVGDSSMASNSQPAQSVTVEDLQSMMRDERYWNPAKRDKAFIKQVDDGFSKLY